ncbi:hypothetical protein [Rhodococcus sp. NCIMB 12038]|uniref:hypothetical protein n=1 Tax=Rhodococcus sp. NCIMB 12038 TaxID=933800 RepID=UPI00211ACA0D|nr:hypothetical protein [Rhodococcus sp. NCIMB 12038]
MITASRSETTAPPAAAAPGRRARCHPGCGRAFAGPPVLWPILLVLALLALLVTGLVAAARAATG